MDLNSSTSDVETDCSVEILEECCTIDLTSSTSDVETDPSVIIIEDSDDEETIALEESLEPELDPEEELQILANDLNVTVDELKSQAESRKLRRSPKKVNYKKLLEQMRYEEIGLVLEQPKSLADMCSSVLKNIEGEQQSGPSTNRAEQTSELAKFYLSNNNPHCEDEDADADYKPMLRPIFTREIRTGPSYQAEVPEESNVDHSADGEVDNGDKLLWKPFPSEKELEKYFSGVNCIVQELMGKAAVCRNRDNEEALEILLESNFNEQLALDLFKKKLQRNLIERNSEIKIQENEDVNTDLIRESIENQTNSSKENIENSNTENFENETSNEFCTPSKVAKIEHTTESKL